MGILSSIQDSFDPDKRPKSFKKGEKFEDFTESFFPPSHYVLLGRTPNYKMNSKGFDTAALLPDFKFQDRRTNKIFYVESKYRKDLFKGKLEWCKDINQLRRYQSYDREIPVFVLIGLGGKPSYPDEVFLIPVSVAKYTGLYPSAFEDFVVEFDDLISSRDLWSR